MTYQKIVIYYPGGETDVKVTPLYSILFFVFLLFALTANLGICACPHMQGHAGIGHR